MTRLILCSKSCADLGYYGAGVTQVQSRIRARFCPFLSESRRVKALKWVAIIVAVLVGVVLFAARQGASDQRRMQAALHLTGNYAGMTEGQLYELGTRISKEGVGTIGEAREVIFWLVCSGRFSSATIEPAAKVALRLVSVQGLSEKDAVARLISMTGSSTPDPFFACPK